MNFPDCGYLYIVHGSTKHFDAVIGSVKSLRKVDPEAHITLLTNTKYDNTSLFNHIIIKEDLMPRTKEEGRVDGRFEGKMKLHLSPYKRTLYLDSDTYFYENCRGLFRLLDWYDFAMSPVAGDVEIKDPNPPYETIQGHTPYNMGVVLFRTTEATLELLETYRRYYREKRSQQGTSNDQPYFLLALAESSCKVHSLPRIYNARIGRFISLYGNVKIAHGKNVNFEDIRGKINETDKIRCWHPWEQKVYYG